MAAGLILAILYLALCGCYMAEKHSLGKARRTLSHVIHVGGIRGKTSVCRMLDAVLRQEYAVITKTTGTNARILDTSGADLPFRRIGSANILEQRKLLWRAKKERAEILIAECMAVQPQLQKVSQHEILQGDIVIITNVRYDHIFEMGETLEEIAQSVSNIIPKRGILFTAEKNFFPFFQAQCAKMGSRAVLCTASEQETENEAIVRHVAQYLGFSSAQISAGLSRVNQDFGVTRQYAMQNQRGEEISFLNLFSVNDPQSTIQQLSSYLKTEKPIYFLYHHRPDRVDRLVLFLRHFFPNVSCRGVFVSGVGGTLAQRKISAVVSCPVTRVTNPFTQMDIPAGSLLVGIGNIKGQAYHMIETLEQGDTP